MMDSVLPTIAVDSLHLPQADVLDLWHSTMGQLFDLEALPHRGPEFCLRSRFWNANGLVLTQGSFSPYRFAREPRRIRADGFDNYTFLLHRGRTWHGVAGEASIHDATGRVLVLDFARPASFQSDQDGAITLSVPRDMLDEVLTPFDMHGLMLQGAWGGVLVDFLQGLPEHVARLPASEAAYLANACRQMLAACLAPSRAKAQAAQGQIDAVLRRRAIRQIDMNLHKPRWSVEELAQAIRVSRSTLYRLFGDEGGVSERIKQRRLMRAHLALTNPADRRGIGAIAAACGFSSDTYFSRAFRAAYGVTPREARAGAAAGGWLRSRPSRDVAEKAEALRWIGALRG
jgi:AraC-like DNA-binding protein